MGLRILVSNDDGYDTFLLIGLYKELVKAGHDVVLSAPKVDQSGAGTADEEPDPENGDTTGSLKRGRINWVNSRPVTAARYGLDKFGPAIWGDQPCDLVISGPNYGWNNGYNVYGSGTLGIARWAAIERNIPAIAISAQSNIRDNEKETLYAGLVNKLVEALAESGKPLLPQNVWLSVHLPVPKGPLPKQDAFKWVLARHEPGSTALYHWQVSLEDDSSFDSCDLDNLPTEQTVLGKCLNRICVSINAENIQCAPQEDKAVVKEKLSGLLEYSRGGKAEDDASSTSPNVDGEHYAEEA